MKKILTLTTGLFMAVLTFAQQDLGLYNLNEIPQSSYSNPSNQFNGNWFLGLPAVSSTYFSFSNTGFAYSDAIKPKGDSLLLDFNSLIGELEDDNFMSFNTRVDLFSFGFRIGDASQLTFNVSEVGSFKFSYPKDFMRFIYEGNAAFEDNTADLDGIGINMIHYREYGLGLSHQLSDKLRLGVRAKYLYGMENLYSKTTDISIRTDPTTYAITANADIEIHSAGLEDVNDESTADYFSGRANRGFAVDFGGNYELNDKISFNASVLDLGFINWKDYTSTYRSSGTFTYDGIAIDALGSDANVNDETSLDRIADSLEGAFEIDTTKGGYTAPLTSRIYAGANYRINERSFTGLVIQSEIFRGRFLNSYTLHYNRKMTKWITLGASYSVINRSYNNLGVAVNINPGPVQFYIVSDNLLGAFQPQHARHLQVRFGMNFIFGSNKSTELRPSRMPEKKSKEKDKKKEEDNQDSDE